jgi:hypothetical protein
VSWDQHHSQSEKLAIDAQMASRAGEILRAEDLYRRAAAEETAAFDALGEDKRRTRGITAVSAVALWYKGRDYPVPNGCRTGTLQVADFRRLLKHSSETYCP